MSFYPDVKKVGRFTMLFAAQEMKLKHRNRYFALAGIVLHPLFYLFALTLIFSRVARVGSDGVPYPLFNVTGLIPWIYFSTCLSYAGISLVMNTHLVTRIPFPRMSVPLASLVSALPNFLGGLVLLAVLFAFFGVKIGLTAAYLVPLFLIQLLFTSGLALILSILVAYAREGYFMLALLLQLGMLVSPVAYSLNSVPPAIKPFYLLNPMAGLIDGYRDVLLHHRAPDAAAFAAAAAVSLACFFAGLLLFRKLEPALADFI